MHAPYMSSLQAATAQNLLFPNISPFSATFPLNLLQTRPISAFFPSIFPENAWNLTIFRDFLAFDPVSQEHRARLLQNSSNFCTKAGFLETGPIKLEENLTKFEEASFSSNIHTEIEKTLYQGTFFGFFINFLWTRLILLSFYRFSRESRQLLA